MEGNTQSANGQPLSALFTWKIENFSTPEATELSSETFDHGGYKWRLLVFPMGNNVADHLSVLLQVADSETLPNNWSVDALFSLTVVNQFNKRYSVNKDAHHQFTEREHDWGFDAFMPLTVFYDPGSGYLVNDTCIVVVEISTQKLMDDCGHLTVGSTPISLMRQLNGLVIDNPSRNTQSANDQPQSVLFTWKIENFSTPEATEIYSETFDHGGYKWRLLVFPMGNNVVDHFSVFLQVADAENWPNNWSIDALFSLTVVNQFNKHYSVNKDAHHQFTEREHDWGFDAFMPLTEFYDPGSGYLVNDTCIVVVEISTQKLIDDCGHLTNGSTPISLMQQLKGLVIDDLSS